MTHAIAVLNAGSSSLKFSLYAVPDGAFELVARGQVEGLATRPRFIAVGPAGERLGGHDWGDGARLGHSDAIAHLFGFLRAALRQYRVVAVGHRVVHGGTRYARPVRVDRNVLAALEEYVPLAPLHQPHNLSAIRIIADHAPDLPQVACFDTAFHHGIPALAQAFALPAAITARGVRRYGFHGLSYEYVASVLPSVDPVAAQGRVVVAHLGNGASMCAMHDRQSVASTMGFTAVDGLMMGTRTGAIDPGAVLYLMDELGMDARAIERLLYQESGLLGVSGLSSDMRALLASDDPRAAFAIELFCYRAVRELGSLAAALGGIDALVFTGGIGEHAAPVRERIVEGGRWLGLALDRDANAASRTRITTPASVAAAYVIPTDEERMIARHTRALLDA